VAWVTGSCLQPNRGQGTTVSCLHSTRWRTRLSSRRLASVGTFSECPFKHSFATDTLSTGNHAFVQTSQMAFVAATIALLSPAVAETGTDSQTHSCSLCMCTHINTTLLFPFLLTSLTFACRYLENGAVGAGGWMDAGNKSSIVVFACGDSEWTAVIETVDAAPSDFAQPTRYGPMCARLRTGVGGPACQRASLVLAGMFVGVPSLLALRACLRACALVWLPSRSVYCPEPCLRCLLLLLWHCDTATLCARLRLSTPEVLTPYSIAQLRFPFLLDSLSRIHRRGGPRRSRSCKRARATHRRGFSLWQT
jgi:hypothetical protein